MKTNKLITFSSMGLMDNDNLKLKKHCGIFFKKMIHETVHQYNRHAQYTFGMHMNVRLFVICVLCMFVRLNIVCQYQTMSQPLARGIN